METIGDRLKKELIDSRGLTTYSIAKALDVGEATVANWIKGKNVGGEHKIFTPSNKYITQLCEIYGMDVMYILKGVNTNKVVQTPETSEEGKKKQIPYYDVDATAGNVTIFAEDAEEYIKEYISVPAFADCEMFINVSGSSMYPKYCSGELIALKKLTDFEVVAYGEAYLIVTREQRLLKYIKKSTQKNMWALHSEHKDYEPFDIHVAKVLHLYIIKGKITKNVI